MKRILPLLLCLVLILGFTGCKGNEETSLSSDGSSTAILSSVPSQQETMGSNTDSSPNTPSKDESTSAAVNSSSNNTTAESKPTQTTTDNTGAITAPNGDKIALSITKTKNPKVVVKVNGKEIFKYTNFENYANQYDFNKDFNNKVIDEYSDDKILWAYRFDWGVIYSTKYNLSDGTEKTIAYVCPKHDYKKSYFKNIWYNILAEEWNLIDFDTIPETGEKIFWDSYTAAQVIFEELYRTENYTLKEIDDLAKAGYSFEDYNDMHQLEFSSGSGLNQWQKIYEVSVKGKPFALIYSDASTSNFSLQELDWQYAYQVYCHYTENGAEYYMPLPGDLKISKIS